MFHPLQAMGRERIAPPILEEKFGSQVSENKRGESFELK